MGYLVKRNKGYVITEGRKRKIVGGGGYRLFDINQNQLVISILVILFYAKVIFISLLVLSLRTKISTKSR
jgi:hypothetical protein